MKTELMKPIQRGRDGKRVVNVYPRDATSTIEVPIEPPEIQKRCSHRFRPIKHIHRKGGWNNACLLCGKLAR